MGLVDRAEWESARGVSERHRSVSSGLDVGPDQLRLKNSPGTDSITM